MMDYLLMVETWIMLAVFLSLAEIIIPGGILLNLGIASVLVALGIKFAILDTWIMVLTVWFIIATFLLFFLNFFTNKFFGGKQAIENVDEELDIFGKEVLVIENIGPGTQKGRVEFQGTTWSALGDGSEIKAGNHAKIICKENISLVVEQVS
jgi:inner membrane protein